MTKVYTEKYIILLQLLFFRKSSHSAVESAHADSNRLLLGPPDHQYFTGVALHGLGLFSRRLSVAYTRATLLLLLSLALVLLGFADLLPALLIVISHPGCVVIPTPALSSSHTADVRLRY